MHFMFVFLNIDIVRNYLANCNHPATLLSSGAAWTKIHAHREEDLNTAFLILKANASQNIGTGTVIYLALYT